MRLRSEISRATTSLLPLVSILLLFMKSGCFPTDAPIVKLPESADKSLHAKPTDTAAKEERHLMLHAVSLDERSKEQLHSKKHRSRRLANSDVGVASLPKTAAPPVVPLAHPRILVLGISVRRDQEPSLSLQPRPKARNCRTAVAAGHTLNPTLKTPSPPDG